MGFYDEMAEVAYELLEEDGETGYLRQSDDTLNDPHRPYLGSTGGVPVDYPAYMVELPIAKNETSSINDLEVTRTMKKFLVEVVTLTQPVKNEDKIFFDGIEYKVKFFKLIKPASTKVLYILFGDV